MIEFLGYLMIFTAGALIHDVPFLRFMSSMMLMSIGTVLIMVVR